ncbi:MAG: 2-isopropylmalate synthase [Planctomycetota bacterium]|nr:MAG: 2-isopropylmalate synthase [Planctomycetota bacterium]
MADNAHDDLIYDWNKVADYPEPPNPIEFDDETLRDGLQCPSVTAPSLADRIKLLHLMSDLGLQFANVGLPGAGPHVVKVVTQLVEEMRDAKLSVAPNCAARTVEADIRPVAEIQQKTGVPIEVSTFIGSSQIRAYTEDWSLDTMLAHSRKALKFAEQEGLEVMFVTEDTTRAHPRTLHALYSAALESPATRRLCFCDTVGHSIPQGAVNLVRWAVELIEKSGRTDVKIDWHGHQDRGLGVPNTIAAIQAGAHRVHGTALGIGERAGNTPMDQLLVNLRLVGWIDNDLAKLGDYVKLTSRSTEVPIPVSYPVFGRDAFETGTGVHAAAVIKAQNKGDEWLANRVYSGVPADMVGLHQVIRVGPMCGKSNVVHWLKGNGYAPDEAVVERLFEAAKDASRLLEDDELHALAKGETAAAGG